MRMMLKIRIPTDAGNRTIKDGSMPDVIEAVMERLNPEAAYFFVENGLRTALIFFEMHEVSDIPAIVEPAFVGMDAKVALIPVMNADDLRKGLKSAMDGM